VAKPKKMAVKKAKPKQRSFEFKLPSASKAVIRSGLVVMGLVGIGFLINQGIHTWHSVWPVKQVLLQGETEYLSEADIAHFVNSQPVKGLLAMDLKQLQIEAAKLDWIQMVEVRKVWPEQLVFSVVEHQPVARFDNYVLTQQGTKISQGEHPELFAHLPEIQLSNNDKGEATRYNEIWQEFRQTRRQFELLSLELNALKVDSVNNWHLTFANGLQMNLGRKHRAERVARLVKVYTAIANKDDIKSIDLRYHNGVSVEWIEQQNNQVNG